MSKGTNSSAVGAMKIPWGDQSVPTCGNGEKGSTVSPSKVTVVFVLWHRAELVATSRKQGATAAPLSH